jgi:hypothetical protein
VGWCDVTIRPMTTPHNHASVGKTAYPDGVGPKQRATFFGRHGRIYVFAVRSASDPWTLFHYVLVDHFWGRP